MTTQAGERTIGDQAPTSAPWQYSLKGLLIVMAIVSICLAIGVHYAGVMFAVLAFGLIQAAPLFVADWLIRPENQKWLAVITAVSWTIVASGLFSLGVRDAYRVSASDTAQLTRSVAAVLIAAGAICYILAFRRWQQLTAHYEI